MDFPRSFQYGKRSRGSQTTEAYVAAEGLRLTVVRSMSFPMARRVLL
jgi:hypothetical protein